MICFELPIQVGRWRFLPAPFFSEIVVFLGSINWNEYNNELSICSILKMHEHVKNQTNDFVISKVGPKLLAKILMIFFRKFWKKKWFVLKEEITWYA